MSSSYVGYQNSNNRKSRQWFPFVSLSSSFHLVFTQNLLQAQFTIMLDRASRTADESAISLPSPALPISIVVDHEQAVDERTGLLTNTEQVKVVETKSRASSVWCVAVSHSTDQFFIFGWW